MLPIVFVPNWDVGIFQVADRGGAVTQVVAIEERRGLSSIRAPKFVADGQRFLFRAGEKILWASVASPAAGEVTEGRSPRFVPPDRVLFTRGDTLFAAVLDGGAMTISGEPLPVLPAKGLLSIAAGENPFSASHTGLLVLRPPSTRDVQLTWFNRQGMLLGTIGGERRATADMRMPRISPDGTRVVTQVRGTGPRSSGIWVFDLERQLPTRIHAEGPGGADAGQMPQWSGDGRDLAFHLAVNGTNGIYRTSVTGLGAPELLVSAGAEAGGLGFPQDWSRDGRYLLYWLRGGHTRGDVWALPLAGDRKPFPVLNTAFDESAPVLSPDGRWIAYRSDVSGTWEIYLQSFTAEGRTGGERIRISTGGGRQPRFRGDGRELFYLADDDQLMTVAISNGTVAGQSEPEVLFKLRVAPRDDRNAAADYDVSPDGQRFLVNAVHEGGATSAPTIVLNWTAGLKK